MEPATISAAAAVVGTIIGGASAAMSGGDSGFTVDDGGGIRYPGNFEKELFVGGHQDVWKSAVSFESDLWWGDNISCQAMMQGYCSGVNDEELVCYPDSDSPNVPANRFAVVNFTAAGDALDHSLLTVNVQTMGVEGDANYPTLALIVSGRMDPYGSGDTNYSFQMFLDIYGQISLGSTDPGETTITDEGGYIKVFYGS